MDVTSNAWTERDEFLAFSLRHVVSLTRTLQCEAEFLLGSEHALCFQKLLLDVTLCVKPYSVIVATCLLFVTTYSVVCGQSLRATTKHSYEFASITGGARSMFHI